MGIHCRPWKSISHVVKSGGSCWYQEWRDGDGNQLVNHSVKHNSHALHPPLLKSIPLEICWHGCNATSSAVVTLQKSRRSSRYKDTR